ncbi:MAG: ABC transporter ATP-binding protein [Planctomycetota bacterium]|jgi:predicted ABC-type transport system involved in lysophospholipase L1 biosynthesis ATPase subunit|nr:ABC transporter ATP-binding protein [Planctomycetota bacterium]MDR1520127.1 ABC transporter ATP-binding protein [Planctomycetota bacterium]
MAGNVLEAEKLSKTYRDGEKRLPVLRDLDLAVAEGEVIAIVGRSGSGKTTLLNLCGLLDRPDTGEIRLRGLPASRLPDSRRTALRGREIGFVFQNYHLLPDFSVLENVMLGAALSGLGMGGRSRRGALDWLERLGLSGRRDHRPSQLSGGERQRAAIARALLPGPGLLLCDEPTGNLDADTGEEVSAWLWRMVGEAGMAVIVVTHESALAARADRIFRLEAGRLAAVARAGGI